MSIQPGTGQQGLDVGRASRSAGPGMWGQRGAAMLLDMAAVVLFAYLGRGAHDGGRAVTDVLEVALPFLLARLLVTVLVQHGSLRLWPGGVVAWLVTWGGGLGLRAALGDGTAVPFVLVALGVIGALFLGWRAVCLLVPRARRR
ncbi:DUF3054 domain-containing protein [Georgenia satyanarayanai]|uniref:DUF3054 domain-containing protein n=1 Tax=Georgenia satyanarayanai TaxID=860221 RepID=UPI00203A9206|nr:DUF3054 domain-containing protein [Georgenia satyanarayanai]MCM3660920.1 DUF3054 domain-containing protein [Georgenia satyanarayanai]